MAENPKIKHVHIDNTLYDVCDDTKVSKSGDIMTGSLIDKCYEVDSITRHASYGANHVIYHITVPGFTSLDDGMRISVHKGLASENPNDSSGALKLLQINDLAPVAIFWRYNSFASWNQLDHAYMTLTYCSTARPSASDYYGYNKTAGFIMEYTYDSGNDVYNLYDYGGYKTGPDALQPYTILGWNENNERVMLFKQDGTLTNRKFDYTRGVFSSDETKTANTAYAPWNGSFYKRRVTQTILQACVTKYGLQTLAVTDLIYAKCTKDGRYLTCVGLTKTLPTTADGYYYMLLAKPYQAYTTASNQNWTIEIDHPILFHNGTAYVDINEGSFVKKTGDTITGDLTIRNSSSTNVGLLNITNPYNNGKINLGDGSLELVGGTGQGNIAAANTLTLKSKNSNAQIVLDDDINAGDINISSANGASIFLDNDISLTGVNSVTVESDLNIKFIGSINTDLHSGGDGLNIVSGSGSENSAIHIPYDPGSRMTFDMNSYWNEDTQQLESGYYQLPCGDGSAEDDRYTLATREWVENNEPKRKIRVVDSKQLVSGRAYHIHISVAALRQFGTTYDMLTLSDISNIVTTIQPATKSDRYSSPTKTIGWYYTDDDTGFGVKINEDGVTALVYNFQTCQEDAEFDADIVLSSYSEDRTGSLNLLLNHIILEADSNLAWEEQMNNAFVSKLGDTINGALIGKSLVKPKYFSLSSYKDKELHIRVPANTYMSLSSVGYVAPAFLGDVITDITPTPFTFSKQYAFGVLDTTHFGVVINNQFYNLLKANSNFECKMMFGNTGTTYGSDYVYIRFVGQYGLELKGYGEWYSTGPIVIGDSEEGSDSITLSTSKVIVGRYGGVIKSGESLSVLGGEEMKVGITGYDGSGDNTTLITGFSMSDYTGINAKVVGWDSSYSDRYTCNYNFPIDLFGHNKTQIIATREWTSANFCQYEEI